MKAHSLDPRTIDLASFAATRPLAAVIADAEALSRRRLRGLLRDQEGVDVVAEAGSGAAAMDAVRSAGADLVFVDPELPQMDGFAVARALAGSAAPLVVFVARTPAHAPRAFEASAFDYLLKPVEPGRLASTLSRARDELVPDPLLLRRSLLHLLQGIQSGRSSAPGRGAGGHLNRVTVKEARGYVLLPVDDILYVEADGNYVTFHLARKSYRHRETLSNLEEKLDPTRFVRVHRSAILNLEHVERLESWYSGDMLAILRNGARVKISRTYRERLEAVLTDGARG